MIDEKSPPGGEFALRLRYLQPGAAGYIYALQPGDCLIAVNGIKFSGSKYELKTRFAESRTGTLVLTFLRNQRAFSVLTDTSDLGRWIETPFPEFDVSEQSAIDPKLVENWEIVRDRRGHYELFPLRKSLVALVAAPLWMLNMRLWSVLAATLSVTGITFLLGPWIAATVYVALSIWVWQNSISLVRFDRSTRGMTPWAVVAAQNEPKAHEACRVLDPSLEFVFGDTGIGVESPKPVES